MMNFQNKSFFQVQEMRQEMRMNPRLYQSMELLYMPLLELQNHLETELEENPFLEMTESDSSDESEEKDPGENEIQEENEKYEEDPVDELSWETFDDENLGNRVTTSETRELWDRPTIETVDLAEHLTSQLRLIINSERDMRLGEEIIGNLSDEGILTCTLEEILKDLNSWLTEIHQSADRETQNLNTSRERDSAQAEINELFTPYDMKEMKESLRIVQGLDPSGVGGRDIKETILIQLERLGEANSLAYDLVSAHFDDLLNHRWDDVAKERGINVGDVQRIADQIATLDPKPGLKYSVAPDTYIVPDLIVEEIEGEWLVFSNDTNLPRLKIANSYKQLLQDPAGLRGENKEFVTQKMNAAHWMVQAIEQRRRTMISVMKFLLEKQRDFFVSGIEHLKPLTLREVADHIQVHESTVSRVVNQKYVQTPRGVFSLKHFFSSGLQLSGGESISAKGVQNKIKNIVDNEDPKTPLSDQKIKSLLEGEGVKIARRTVAKYRDQIGIPPTRVRKRV